MEEFFSPISSEYQKPAPNVIQRSDADQSQIIGGDADVDHSQITGRDAVKLLGGYIPPSPRTSAPLVVPHKFDAIFRLSYTPL